MQAVMFAYAFFAGVIVLLLVTILLVAGISAVVRKIRGSKGRPQPPAQS